MSLFWDFFEAYMWVTGETCLDQGETENFIYTSAIFTFVSVFAAFKDYFFLNLLNGTTVNNNA